MGLWLVIAIFAGALVMGLERVAFRQWGSADFEPAESVDVLEHRKRQRLGAAHNLHAG